MLQISSKTALFSKEVLMSSSREEVDDTAGALPIRISQLFQLSQHVQGLRPVVGATWPRPKHQIE